MKCKLLKKKDEVNNDLACRLIFEIRKQKFAVDFVVSKTSSGKITAGVSGFVGRLEEFEPFESFTKREVDK